MNRLKDHARRVAACGAVLTIAATALTACGGGTKVGAKPSAAVSASSPYGFKTAAQKPNAKITVWVDSTRLPIAQAYNRAHPGNPVTIVTYDGDANGSNSFKTKSALFDRAGSGWPDVVFTTDNNAASWGSLQGTGALAPLNKGLVPSSELSQFATGSLGVCTVDGTTYCLRNDLAQNVLWYNAPLMKRFGYKVPTSWTQYEALGEQVARQHPGYIIGTAGDAWTPEIYMWGAECPANDVTGPKTVTVDTANPNCVAMAKILDTLIADKTISTQSLFGPTFAKTEADKVLMLPGPSWYGGSVFQGTLKTPKGQIAVAPPLTWQGAKVTGDVGGGAWWVSSHSKNLKAATQFAEWVTSAYKYGSSLSPTYPANTQAAAKWVTATQKSGYYANNIAAPIEAAANIVWSGWGSAGFSQESIWAQTVEAGMTQGKSIQSLLPAWQTQIEDQAKVLGYTVNK